MYAYLIPDLSPQGGHGAIAEHPVARRIAHAGPWQLKRHGSGVMATFRNGATDIADYGEPVLLSDGMTFLPWKDGPSKTELRTVFARPESAPEQVVQLACGLDISIALAVTQIARRRTFSNGGALGDITDEYALLARALLDAIKAEDEPPLPMLDARLLRFMFLAVARRYRVTEDALDRWDIISTADDLPIWRAALGADPKADAAVAPK